MILPTTLRWNVLLSEPNSLERSQRYVKAWTTLTLEMKRLPLEVETLGEGEGVGLGVRVGERVWYMQKACRDRHTETDRQRHRCTNEKLSASELTSSISPSSLSLNHLTSGSGYERKGHSISTSVSPATMSSVTASGSWISGAPAIGGRRGEGTKRNLRGSVGAQIEVQAS